MIARTFQKRIALWLASLHYEGADLAKARKRIGQKYRKPRRGHRPPRPLPPRPASPALMMTGKQIDAEHERKCAAVEKVMEGKR
jgi:hypothetical protein